MKHSFSGQHEIHVTTDPASTDPEHFSSVCQALDVKPHVIYNEMPSGGMVVDYLTGSAINTTSAEAFREMGRIASGLRASGLEVVREKIETPPWHPSSPKSRFDRMEPGTYFECHFTLPDRATIHGARILKWQGVPFLISTTERKRAQGKLFATLRHYTATAKDFTSDIDALHEALSGQIPDVSLPTVEYALYDSNPDHDREWVDSYKTAVAIDLSTTADGARERT